MRWAIVYFLFAPNPNFRAQLFLISCCFLSITIHQPFLYIHPSAVSPFSSSLYLLSLYSIPCLCHTCCSWQAHDKLLLCHSWGNKPHRETTHQNAILQLLCTHACLCVWICSRLTRLTRTVVHCKLVLTCTSICFFILFLLFVFFPLGQLARATACLTRCGM